MNIQHKYYKHDRYILYIELVEDMVTKDTNTNSITITKGKYDTM